MGHLRARALIVINYVGDRSDVQSVQLDANVVYQIKLEFIDKKIEGLQIWSW